LESSFTLANTVLSRGDDNGGMKTLMLTGALIGFVLGITLGLVGQAQWPSMLWHACAAAAVLGLLTRWWAGVWVSSLRASLEQRRAVEAAVRPPNPPTSLAKK
jgi:hypothetical protein